MKQILVIFFTLLTCIACKSNDENIGMPDKSSVQKAFEMTVDGKVRNFLIYLPKGYKNAGKMPLIFVVHGGNGTPEGMMKLANFKSIADSVKVVLVYPEGLSNGWNDGRPTSSNDQEIDDVAFFNNMIDYMIANFSVDSSRVYATGISNGGFMSSRLACELSSRIAAIAVVAATMEATEIAPTCNPSHAVPALYIHGTSDPLVPFLGGEMLGAGTAGGEILSHYQVVDKWVDINKCVLVPSIIDIPNISSDGTTIKQRIYKNGVNGSEVQSFIVFNGGHTWPQGYQYLSEAIIGKTSQDMNACKVIWSFFSKFKRI